MKKRILIWLAAVVCLLGGAIPAHADMGPKPSVVLRFSGLEGETFYATLLSKTDSTGPYSALQGGEEFVHYQEGDPDYAVFLRFVEYEDSDGFYFLQYFENCTGTQEFRWTYYPPQTFKILLYFPKEDRFLASEEICERYAFDSYFTVSFVGDALTVGEECGDGDPSHGSPALIVQRSYDYREGLLTLLARIVLTILLELGVALLFGFREKRQLAFLTVVNVITQVILNVSLALIDYYWGGLAFWLNFLLLELAVFLLEAAVYTVFLRRFSRTAPPRWKPAVYALAANAVSCLAGVGLSLWIPRLF